MNNLKHSTAESGGADRRKRRAWSPGFRPALLIAAAGLSLAAAGPAAAGRDQAIRDARLLVEAYETHYAKFRELVDFDRVSHLWPDKGEAWLAMLNDLPQGEEVETFMAALLDKYPGDSIFEVDGYFRNELGIGDADIGGSTTMTTAFRQLEQQLERAAQLRKDVAAGAVSMGRQTMRQLDARFFIPEIRMDKARALKSELQLARQFDPANPELNQMLAQIDVYIDEVAQGITDEINAGRWPEAYGETQHTPAALAFLRSHPEWGGKDGVEVLAVAVDGDWVITERDLLGRPIQWGLTMSVAATKPEWRELDAARVFYLTVLARQDDPAPKAPPFTGYWVGESYLMRLDKVPKG